MVATDRRSEMAALTFPSVPDSQLTFQHVNELKDLQGNDLWVAAACADRILEDVPVQRALLDLGIERTQKAVERARAAYTPPVSGDETTDVVPSQEKRLDSLTAYFCVVQEDAQLCRLRDLLLDRMDRLNTFVEICGKIVEMEGFQEDDTVSELEEDPWATTEEEPPTVQHTQTRQQPVSLATLLSGDILRIACLQASLQCFSALSILLYRHGSHLWPHRYTILDAIPEHSHPTQYRDLLPGFDLSTNRESVPKFQDWRAEADWSQYPEVRAALESSGITFLPALVLVSHEEGRPDPLTSEELTQWYKDRVNRIMTATGMVDISLSIIQHGASQGVLELDGLGEELSLLSRLAYDSVREGALVDEDWTLDRWRSMDPPAAVRAYLAHSTPATVAKDTMRLVLPYLFVLQSRTERLGSPDPTLVKRLLYDYILSAPLEIVHAIFEASKPTLSQTQRIIHDNQDMARLALACLYGSDSLDEWATMSGIFECLPVWDNAREGDKEAADATLTSLGIFVSPTTARPRCAPSDLLTFFEPLPLASLSRALDILDVHLESGEILSKWAVPAPMRWFLQSRSNVTEQRAWATRMARRAGGSHDQPEAQEDWECLLNDMLRLSAQSEAGLNGAFGLLSRDEVIRIFFGGLLSTGKFKIAKWLLYSPRLKDELALNSGAVEEMCLTCSREFYDNASSGNYTIGDMKLAYECLDVPPLSARLLQEKDFIEATSRLSSFNITSRPGIPISPIEIRLTEDKLSLVSRVLSSNADAYKHTKVILDLVHKLGFRGDAAAEVKTLAMLADAALHVQDFRRAYENSERMAATVLQLRAVSPAGGKDAKVQEAIGVCWVACYQLGRHPEFDDVPKKLLLLGRALELCPSENLHEVLTSWRNLEKVDVEARQERLANWRQGVIQGGAVAAAKDTVPSLASRLQSMRSATSGLAHAPDLAARTFNRVAANLPFSVRPTTTHHSLNEEERSTSPTGHGGDVSTQATRVLQKGIGWLLGTEDV